MKPDHRPILPAAALPLDSWPLGAHSLDEPDGGTFFLPPQVTWHDGTATTPSDNTGAIDDYYFNTSRHEWWGPKAATDPEDEDDKGTWVGTGPTALAAPASPHVWVNGSGDPDDETDGSDGDLYFDTASHSYYGPKAGGSWTGTGPEYIVSNWVVLEDGPFCAGSFSVPAIEISCGDEDGSTSGNASIELADPDKHRLEYLTLGTVTATPNEAGAGGVVSGSGATNLIELYTTDNGAKIIQNVRWKVSGDENLGFVTSGSLVQLK